MKQNTLNFWVDLASLIMLLALVFTGLLIYYVLPPCGSCTGEGCSTKSLSPCGSSVSAGCFIKALSPCSCSTGAVCSNKVLPLCGGCSGTDCSIEGEPAIKAEPTLWGLGRHDYGDIHFKLALAVITLMLLHIILHWSWVCTTIGNMLNLKVDRSGRSSLYGIILLMLIIILTTGGLCWLKTQIQY